MGMQGLSYQELLQLVELIKSSSQFREFRLRSGDLELELRRGGPDAPVAPASSAGAPLNGHSAPHAPAPTAGPAPAASQPAPVAARPSAPASAKEVRELPEGATVIKSPMVGTFYRAPEPGARPFVEVGAAVAPDTMVCIIEVMKLMNSIPAQCRGTVAEILVGDGEAVEYGQPLIVVTPV